MTCLSSISRIVVLCSWALVAGCLDEPDPGDPALGVDEAELTGAATTARPGIGRVHRDGTSASCAATLVASEFILTGESCIGSRTSATPFAGATFHFVDVSGVRRLVRVGSVSGFRHLAFGRLVEPVPPEQAAPIPFAITTPRPGHQVSAFGWLGADVTQKRVQTFFDDGVELASPITFETNDSGAPHLWGPVSANGDVWGVAVRTTTPFAKHVTHYQRHFEGLLERWSSSLYGWDRPGMDLRALTTYNEWDCNSACSDDARCRAWTFNSAQLTCYLKEGVAPLRPGPLEAVTGRPWHIKSARFDGHDLTSLTTARREQCEQACGANPQCQAYSWEVPTGFCVLKGAVGPRINSTTWQSGVVVRSEVDFDRPGSDYAVDTVADRAACTQLCAGEAQCLAYTFVEASRACWRKDGVPWGLRSAGMQSGRKLGLHYNLDYPGGDYRSFTTTATDPASTCQATCARESACKAWAVSEATSTPTCHLKSSISSPVFKDRIVSGLKGLEFTAGQSL